MNCPACIIEENSRKNYNGAFENLINKIKINNVYDFINKLNNITLKNYYKPPIDIINFSDKYDDENLIKVIKEKFLKCFNQYSSPLTSCYDRSQTLLGLKNSSDPNIEITTVTLKKHQNFPDDVGIYGAKINENIFEVNLIFMKNDNNAKSIILLINPEHCDEKIKRLQDENNYKDGLLATVSHELRAPLSGNLNFIEVAINRDDVPYDVKNNLLIPAHMSGKLLLHFVNDILDYMQYNSQKLRLVYVPANIEETLNNCIYLVEFLAKKKGIKLLTNYDQCPKDFTTDHNRLSQIVINLLNNSLKFTSNGYVKLSTQNSGESILISIEDSGMGIKEEDKNKLFEVFTKIDLGSKIIDNSSGAGLGLTIANNLAIRLGPASQGGIHVETEYQKGSRFWFLIENKGQIYSESMSDGLMPMLQKNNLGSPIFNRSDRKGSNSYIKEQKQINNMNNNLNNRSSSGYFDSQNESFTGLDGNDNTLHRDLKKNKPFFFPLHRRDKLSLSNNTNKNRSFETKKEKNNKSIVYSTNGISKNKNTIDKNNYKSNHRHHNLSKMQMKMIKLEKITINDDGCFKGGSRNVLDSDEYPVNMNMNVNTKPDKSNKTKIKTMPNENKIANSSKKCPSILIVDDDRFITSSFEAMIDSLCRKLGQDYGLVIANGGIEAMHHINQILQRNYELSPNSNSENREINHKYNFFRLIFLDYNMPDMNGLQTAKAIIECLFKYNIERSRVILICCTGNDMKNVDIEDDKHIFDFYVVKPLDLKLLEKILRNYVN